MKANLIILLPCCAALIGLGTGCASNKAESNAPMSLKAAYKKDFLMGVAINRAQFTGEDARGDAIIKAQFNSISPENVLKWESVHPEPGKYDFTGSDRYVEFGEA